MTTVKDYTLLTQLASGSITEVYKARKSNRQICVLKTWKISLDENRNIDKLDERKAQEKELDVLKKQLNHENIVSVFEAFRDHGDMYIAMELCEGGDLNQYFIKNRPEMKERFSIMSDIARGVNYLHNQKIIHYNLTPENVLLKFNGDRFACKITDYVKSKSSISKYDVITLYDGHTSYMPPEILTQSEISSSVDIFTMGLLYFAVFNCMLLRNESGKLSLIPGKNSPKGQVELLNEKIIEKKINKSTFLSFFNNTYDTGVGLLIYSMLNIKPEERPNAETLALKLAQEEARRELELEYKAKKEKEEIEAFRLQERLDDKDAVIRSLQRKNKLLTDNNSKLQKQVRDLQQVVVEMKKENTTACYGPSKNKQLCKHVMLETPKLLWDAKVASPDIGDVWKVLALSDGKALIAHENWHWHQHEALLIDRDSTSSKPLYRSTVFITGFIQLQGDILILHKEGKITRHSTRTGEITQTYTVDVGVLYDGTALDEDNLLLVDSQKDQVFTYCLSENRKDVKIRGLHWPTSVVKVPTGQGLLFAVCEAKASKVHIYDSSWTLVRSLGASGPGSGQLHGPMSVVALPSQTLLVADNGNHRVTEYTLDGNRVHDCLLEKHGIHKPTNLSYTHPYLWVVSAFSHLECYQIFET